MPLPYKILSEDQVPEFIAEMDRKNEENRDKFLKSPYAVIDTSPSDRVYVLEIAEGVNPFSCPEIKQLRESIDPTKYVRISQFFVRNIFIIYGHYPGGEMIYGGETIRRVKLP